MSYKSYSESLTSCVDVYNAHGLSLVSMPYGEKRPNILEWPTLKPDPHRINPDNDNQNIGVVLGANSGGLVDIDLDCPEAVLAAKHLLPDTGMIFGRDSAGDSHYLYRIDGPVKTRRFQSADKRTILEIRGDGAQTVVPPSFHAESGEFRRWRKLDGIAKVDAEDLSLAVQLIAACVDIAPAFVEGSRHDLYLALAGVLKRHGYPLDTAQGVVRALVDITRDNDLADRLHACRDTYEKDEADKTTGIPTLLKLAGEHGEAFLRRLGLSTLPEMNPESAPQYEYLLQPEGFLCTDAANGARFCAEYERELAAVGKSTWLRYINDHWHEVDQSALIPLTHKIARKLQHELPTDEEKRKSASRWASESLNNHRAKGMIEAAKGYLVKDQADFDAKDRTQFLINFRNGTFDVSKGLFRRHDPADQITKVIDAVYDPEAECPRFQSFVQEIFEGDELLIDYVLTVLGYCLTGSTREQLFFVFHGSGKNGKSTLTDLMTYVMGDYALVSDPAMLMEKPFINTSSTPDIARLAGARFVLASEGDKNQKLAAGLVKRLTGDDRLTGCFKYQNPFEFNTQFKIVYQTNEIPKMDSSDEAIWRRITPVPFSFVVPADKRNENLLEELKEEKEGVLALLVRYACKWHQCGLPSCGKVSNYKTDLRSKQDSIEQFIRDRLERRLGAKTSCSEMYRAYEEFCRREGLEALPKQKFNNAFAQKGFEKGKSGVDIWKGVILTEIHYSPPADAGLDDVI